MNEGRCAAPAVVLSTTTYGLRRLSVRRSAVTASVIIMTKLVHPYILTATLLVAHQIDSAYWHEWNLFGIPGGIQAFVLLNVPLILLFLVGLAKVATGAHGAARYSSALALVSAATFFIHVGFAWRQHPEFGMPASWVILCGTLLASLGLGWRTLRGLHTKKETQA
jgi:hypothetical protein